MNKFSTNNPTHNRNRSVEILPAQNRSVYYRDTSAEDTFEKARVERMKLEKIRQKRNKQIEAQAKKLEEEEKVKEKETFESNRSTRHEKAEKKVEEFRIKETERAKKKEEENKAVNHLLHSKPLYKKYEETKKAPKQPVNKVNPKLVEESKKGFKPSYESKFYKEWLDDYKKTVRGGELKKEQMADIKAKLDSLDRNIKENFPPEISEKKRSEIEERIEKERAKELAHMDRVSNLNDYEKAREIGKEYLKDLRAYTEKHGKKTTNASFLNESQLTQNTTESQGNNNNPSNILKKTKPPVESIEILKKKAVKVKAMEKDLEMLAKAREELKLSSNPKHSAEVLDTIKMLKYRIASKAQDLETEVNVGEQLNSIKAKDKGKGKKDDLKTLEEKGILDEFILDSIRAKVSLID